MRNHETSRIDQETEGAGAHGPVMGRDLLAAALLTVAAAVCMVVAWNGGSSVENASKSGGQTTEISEPLRLP